MSKPILNDSQAACLRKLVRLYKPAIGKSWRKRSPDELWLRVLSQVVVAGNAAPGDTLRSSPAVKERLGYARLLRLSGSLRRRRIHRVLQAIGTRYVGKNARNKKVDAALHNFTALAKAGGPRNFFKEVAAEKGTLAKVKYLSDHLKYYKNKGCRDILIEFRLAKDCMALDQRIMNILGSVGVKIQGSINKRYQQVEHELITKVARPTLTGGQLDRILFKNYADIKVRLFCP